MHLNSRGTSPRRVVLLLVALCLGAGLAPQGAAGPQPAAVLAQSEVGSYALSETWADAAWQLRAGHYGEATDVTVVAGGRTYVLDGYHRAIHILASDGEPERVVPLDDDGRGFAAMALDAAPGGGLHVLWTMTGRGARSRVDRLDGEGVRLRSYELSLPYDDIAVRGDGRVYLVHSGETALQYPPALDVYSRDFLMQEPIYLPELGAPLRVDVAPDDFIYILQTIAAPPSGRPPGPFPTPGPSTWSAGPAQIEPIAGVLVLDPGHAYVRTVPFDAGVDVAAGPAGVFVSRFDAVYSLGAVDPLSPVATEWSGRPNLAVTAREVLVALSHCAFEGVVRADAHQEPSPGRLRGHLDRPALEGPVYPLRLAAGSQVGVLQGRFRVAGTRPDHWYATTPTERQTVQSWAHSGQLTGQMGTCTGGAERGRWAVDVAASGSDTYVVDRQCVTYRPDHMFPAWSYCATGQWGQDIATNIVAASAHGPRVALLDAAANGVVIVDNLGRVEAAWRVTGEVASAPLVDLAIDASSVVLADRGRARIRVFTLAGELVSEWPIHDGPRSVAIAPTGEIVVLGAAGWGLTYSSTGDLTAAWRLPDWAAATDLDVDASGRVLVSHVNVNGSTLQNAGIWVYTRDQTPNQDVPPLGPHCRAVPDKSAAPRRVTLGDSVEVRLRVTGECPPASEPSQVVAVLDTSRSMNWSYALDSAKAAVVSLLGAVNPDVVEVALVTFDDEARLVQPLSRDLSRVAALAVAARAQGATRLAAGLQVAVEELVGPRGDVEKRRIILLVSDGVPNDDPWPVLQSVRRHGLELHGLLFQDGQAADRAFVSQLDGPRDVVLFDPDPASAAAHGAGLADLRVPSGLFDSLVVTDELPENMDYVPGSAHPPAVQSGRSLTWNLGAVAAGQAVDLSFRVLPRQVGVWPTNVVATGDVVDVYANRGRIVFPVPEVEVIEPASHQVFLPFATRHQCFRKSPIDVALVLDTSSSMADPSGLGGTKLDAARGAALEFVSHLALPRDQAAVVAFDAQATVAAGLSGDIDTLRTALNGLTTRAGTRIDLGLIQARAVLEEARPGAATALVLLTDGQHGGAHRDVLEAANVLRGAGTHIFSVGLGADVELDLLEAVAGSRERLLVSPTAADLSRVYAEISERLVCATGN